MANSQHYAESRVTVLWLCSIIRSSATVKRLNNRVGGWRIEEGLAHALNQRTNFYGCDTVDYRRRGHADEPYYNRCLNYQFFFIWDNFDFRQDVLATDRRQRDRWPIRDEKTAADVHKGAITSKIKHATKLKTSPARLAQLLHNRCSPH